METKKYFEAMMPYAGWVLKRRIESLLMAPFVGLGRLMAKLFPLEKEYKIFFFFPFYHTGGAEKIHAQIVRACGGKDCIVFFTRHSLDDNFWEDFVSSGCAVRNISPGTDNKWLYPLNFFYRGLLSGYINKQQTAPIVFNGHSNFAYKLSPWIKKDISQIDLVHSFNSFSMIRIPFLSYYYKTVLISKVKEEEHRYRYRQLQVPENYLQRFVHIPNAAQFPFRNAADKPVKPFQILYIGRFSPEKRFPLFLQVAEKVYELNPAIRFKVIGVEAGQVPSSPPNVSFEGTLHDNTVIQEHCFQSHLLLITSETEGLPVAMIEAMANGCAIAATPVGDIPLHIGSGRGLIFSSIDESTVVSEAVPFIVDLAANNDSRQAMASENIAYANAHFSITNFNQAYQHLLFNQNPKM